MMVQADTHDVQQVAAAVADIARTLESPKDLDMRTRRVLELVGTLVPYDRCVLLKRLPGRDLILAVPSLREESTVRPLLVNLLQYIEGATDQPWHFSSAAHLALPVIGLDQVIGVLLVERNDSAAYEPHHLRLLSAVVSQLGGYLTMVRLHEDTVRKTHLLAEREQDLQRAAQFREEFIGVVGHDLRNPLSAILTGGHLLLDQGRLTKSQMLVAQRIISSARRMNRMVDELVDFARGRLGSGIPISRNATDLRHVCQAVVDELHLTHPSTRIALTATGNLKGQWDKGRLTQALSNLAWNAVQYSTSSSVIRIDAVGEVRSVRLTVTNEGSTIAADELASLFEPFRRGRRRRKNASGLGLGLYIVDRIVRAHEGTIEVRSNRADGTSFIIRLPRVSHSH